MIKIHKSGFLYLIPLLLVLSASCGRSNQPIPEPELIKFDTSDGVTIYGDYYKQVKPSPLLILLHMYGRNRTTWAKAIPDWYNRGFAVVAIDMRGHGNSLIQNGQPIRFDQQGNAELFKQAWKDVEAAVNFLEQDKNVVTSRTVLAGASIGCTVALIAGSKLDYVRSAVLMSPGEKYLGIDSCADIRNFAGKPLFMVSDQKEAPACETLIEAGGYSSDNHVVFPDAGHGTMMFDSASSDMVIRKIGLWLERESLE